MLGVRQKQILANRPKKTWNKHYSDWIGLNIWWEENKRRQGGRIDLKEVFSLTLYGSSPSLTVRASFSQVSLEWRVCTQSLKRNSKRITKNFWFIIQILICGMGYGLSEVRQGPVWIGPLLAWLVDSFECVWRHILIGSVNVASQTPTSYVIQR